MTWLACIWRPFSGFEHFNPACLFYQYLWLDLPRLRTRCPCSAGPSSHLLILHFRFLCLGLFSRNGPTVNFAKTARLVKFIDMRGLNSNRITSNKIMLQKSIKSARYRKFKGGKASSYWDLNANSNQRIMIAQKSAKLAKRSCGAVGDHENKVHAM